MRLSVCVINFYFTVRMMTKPRTRVSNMKRTICFENIFSLLINKDSTKFPSILHQNRHTEENLHISDSGFEIFQPFNCIVVGNPGKIEESHFLFILFSFSIFQYKYHKYVN